MISFAHVGRSGGKSIVKEGKVIFLQISISLARVPPHVKGVYPATIS